MADVGSLTELVLAQHVELGIGSGTDKYVLMRGCRVEKSHPERRIDHGTVATHTHAYPNMAIRFTLSASSDVFEDLNDLCERDDNDVLPVSTWNFRATDVSGTTKTLSMSGKLVEFNADKPTDAAEDPVNMDGMIRVTSAITVA